MPEREIANLFASVMRMQMYREAVASVSLSHAAGCGCKICLAVEDEERFLALYAEFIAIEEGRA